MAITRRPLIRNLEADRWTVDASLNLEAVNQFHSHLPGYEPTPLIALPNIAKELGVGTVHLKDESKRLGLPSFKILGASWGAFRAVAQRLDLPPDASLQTVKDAASSSSSLALFAATDGNHGRAVARMGAILGLPVRIFVPRGMHAATIALIEGEGAVVLQTSLSYDEAVQLAFATSKEQSGILVQDTAFAGYTTVPEWIVQGYATMLREIDSQMAEGQPDFVLVPVGVGCLAQAVVQHYRTAQSKTRVITVEPDTAASLWKDLREGKTSPHQTYPTIMAGMDCGTVSTTAWPLLRCGVSGSITVSDYESHQSVQRLQAGGISAGPCGAGPLAALQRLSAEDKLSLGMDSQSSIVLLCTEGARDYPIPLDTSPEDAASLTQALVRINSANPSLGQTGGPGEAAVARYVAAWLERRDIETHWIEPSPGRPSVIGVVRGGGGGKRLMFNGHIDTVSVSGYEGDPLSGEISDGRVYGRGAADMKGGIAAAMLALVRAKSRGLQGDVIFAGVADEEANSIGTEDILRAGWTADAALVNEPTNLEIVAAHKGFVWLDIDVQGVASHGSRADLGLDAICKAGYVLVELDKLAQKLRRQASESKAMTPTVHASLIRGGEEQSSYPSACKIQIEWRTVAGETEATVRTEISALLERVALEVPDLKYSIRTTFSRPPFELPRDHSFARLVSQSVASELGGTAELTDVPYWTDCALLADAGIPAMLFGPRGEGLHAKTEWVDIESVEKVATILEKVAQGFCG